MRIDSRVQALSLVVVGVFAAGRLEAQATLASNVSAAHVSAAPTFYADVLPILQDNCQACHQPAGLNMGGMVAPFSLMTYEEARPWADAIALAVKERRMPPWHASEAHRGRFVGERYLDADEVETLIAWAAAQAPAGSPPPGYQLPVVPTERVKWALGEPDLVLRPNEAYCMKDDDVDVYVDLPSTISRDVLPEDRWIKSVEYRPGKHVHHIIQADWGGLVPGAEPNVYEDGYGRLLRAGDRTVNFDMHYNKVPGEGTAVCDDTEVGIRFMEEGEVIRYTTGGNALMIRDFLIPAGDSFYSSSMEFEFPRDVLLRSFMPHMHLRGKAAMYELVYPDGRTEMLLHVPDYDFNWQHTYEFKEPVLAPAGSKVRMTLWWDNSPENPTNPDPTADVRWGLPTHAEMGQGYMSWREIEERHVVVGQAMPTADQLPGTTDPEVEDPHASH